MKKVIFFLLAVSWLFASNTLFVCNGKSIVVELVGDVNYTAATVDGKEFFVYPHPKKSGSFYTIIPMDYYAKESNSTILMSYFKDGVRQQDSLMLEVTACPYKTEVLSVDSSRVVLSEENQKRADEEKVQAAAIYATISPVNYMVSKFNYPLDSVITSAYGNARTYNGILQSYHGGTDFRAANGTVLTACNDGAVVLVGDRFYSGGTVILDHGRGIYSTYFHMSEFGVKVGDVVKKGDKLGLSGSSGRVTGPHLHFGMVVSGVQVDPLHFIDTMNKTLLGE